MPEAAEVAGQTADPDLHLSAGTITLVLDRSGGEAGRVDVELDRGGAWSELVFFISGGHRCWGERPRISHSLSDTQLFFERDADLDGVVCVGVVGEDRAKVETLSGPQQQLGGGRDDRALRIVHCRASGIVQDSVP